MKCDQPVLTPSVTEKLTSVPPSADRQVDPAPLVTVLVDTPTIHTKHAQVDAIAKHDDAKRLCLERRTLSSAANCNHTNSCIIIMKVGCSLSIIMTDFARSPRV